MLKTTTDPLILPFRTVSLGFTFFILLAISVAVCFQATRWFAGLYFFPFYGTPLVITAWIMFRANSFASLAMLLTSSLLYGAWFAYAYHDAFYAHPDAQSALVIIVVGLSSLPVMIPLWCLAAVSFSRESIEIDQRNESKI